MIFYLLVLYQNNSLLKFKTNMTLKTIKNEQWYVKDLVARINNGEISKPKFQRKRKWDILPKKDTVPSERNYIDFLRETKNSVHPITFGSSQGKYTNIDGNNRINAICHFMTSPFDIYPEYFELIQKLIIDISPTDRELPDDIKQKIITIFCKMTYPDIINLKSLKHYFTDIINEKDLYTKYLKGKNDEYDPIITELQNKFSNGTDRFDLNTTINVNIFEGYTTEELCNIFGKINKYNNALTARELLASTLFTRTDFVINNSVFEAELRKILKDNYSRMHNSDDEKLALYEFDINAPLNAYDFITGFELIAFSKSNIINNQFNDTTGLSLLFKVYTIMYGNINNAFAFTTENINDFIVKVNCAIDILKKLENKIAISKITSTSSKTFDECHKKLSSLRINSQTILLLGIIGHLNANTPEKEILASAERCILFHLMFKDIQHKETKTKYTRDNILNIHSTSGAFVNETFNKVYKHPNELHAKITKQKMTDVLDILITENINDGSQNKVRKSRRFHESILIQSYYNIKMPLAFLNKNYWIEHIFPFSSSASDNADYFDIDRLGNIIPIIDEINSKRGTKHIREYAKLKDGKDFIKHLSDIIPPSEVYDTIITHASGQTQPKIINPAAYSALCAANEKKYRDIFLNQLYPEQNS